MSVSTLLGGSSFERFCQQEFGEFPRLVGRYCSYLLPKEAGGTPQILILKTLGMMGRLTVYITLKTTIHGHVSCTCNVGTFFYRYWITVEGLCDEVGDDSTILEVHSGPVGVEYPGDTYIDPFLASV